MYYDIILDLCIAMRLNHPINGKRTKKKHSLKTLGEYFTECCVAHSAKEASPSVLHRTLGKQTVGSPSTAINTQRIHFQEIK
jgi:hypothetical protein